MALFAAQPFGSGLFLRDAAFLVAHLEQPNFTPRAIPMDGVNAASPPGAGAALSRAKTSSGAAVNDTSTGLGASIGSHEGNVKSWAYVWAKHYQNPRCPAEPSVDRPRNY
ncbi:hypothetical protein NA647_14280 [Pseudomonas stutzeri]|uniref:hypothetical protein n=1 Tax=Stutzerimonas stutzeri TaxID=316 RepID=UPI00210CA436|nr:hypothetical protein [Stutzerimonas stutzeri]MCQ4288596.1 hypothetical protein [Stutzerimonas stutzeri]